MITKLLKMLFVPKRARTGMTARRKTLPPASKPSPPTAPKADSGDRGKLLADTMALYRQQRQDVYDTLDEATKRQIEEDAEKAFGQALNPKS